MCPDHLEDALKKSDRCGPEIGRWPTGRKQRTTGLPVLLAVVAVVAASSVSAQAVSAQAAHTENTIRLGPAGSSPPASIGQFSFLQGHWTGEGLGGEVDELWSRPAGGTMVGAFRLIREGSVVFYEIFALEEDEDTVVLRLKHFDPGPGLPGWEERDRETLFRLVRVEGNVAWFGGLTFRLSDPDTLMVYLALRSGDGPLREEVFHFRRSQR